MEDIDFIKKFTNSIEVESNIYSCLMIAISDARKITGRNIETGKQEFNILVGNNDFLNPDSFIGIINYLLILDMIGEIFKKNGFTFGKKNKNKKIGKALKQFGGVISDCDIDVIVALRNSLAHNYGLINIPWEVSENGTKRHKFTLINTDCEFLIKYPPENNRWDGDFKDKSETTSTEVSKENLINLIETVFKNLKQDLENNEVKLALNDGIDELKARFTIKY